MKKLWEKLFGKPKPEQEKADRPFPDLQKEQEIPQCVYGPPGMFGNGSVKPFDPADMDMQDVYGPPPDDLD